MAVGEKENSKKKLMRCTWAGHVEKMGDEKLAESRCPESEREMDAKKTKIAMVDCIKNDLERVGEE